MKVEIKNSKKGINLHNIYMTGKPNIIATSLQIILCQGYQKYCVKNLTYECGAIFVVKNNESSCKISQTKIQ